VNNLKEVRVVGEEKEKNSWNLSEMSFEPIEESVFRSLLFSVAGKKFNVEELKEIGDVRASRKGGLIVKTGVSKDREANMFFGNKYGKYVYRGVYFTTIPKEKGE